MYEQENQIHCQSLTNAFLLNQAIGSIDLASNEKQIRHFLSLISILFVIQYIA